MQIWGLTSGSHHQNRYVHSSRGQGHSIVNARNPLLAYRKLSTIVKRETFKHFDE